MSLEVVKQRYFQNKSPSVSDLFVIPTLCITFFYFFPGYYLYFLHYHYLRHTIYTDLTCVCIIIESVYHGNIKIQYTFNLCIVPVSIHVHVESIINDTTCTLHSKPFEAI